MLDPLSIDLSSHGTSAKILPQRKLLQPSPDHSDDYILEMDYSSISKFIECPREGQNYLINGREANKDRSATDFGRLFHVLEETRLRAGEVSAALQQSQAETIAMHFLQHPVPPGDHRTADMMTTVMSSYNKTYGTDGWSQKTLVIDGEPMVERAFKVPLMTIAVNADLPYYHGRLVVESNDDYNGESTFPVRNIHVVYTGRIDLVLTEGDFIWVVDHKTSSRGGRQFEEAFRLSLQTRGYCWAAQELIGQPVTGLILNGAIIRVPTRTGKGIEFLRRNYFYSQESISEWVQETRYIITDFVTALARGYFPQYARSFNSPCAMCDYSENCTLPPSQRVDDLASELYRDVTWNPIH